jgi:uncharacterized protein
MEHFTPGSALIGGVLIGLAASALLFFNGRVAGVTTILAGVLRPQRGELAWRAAFVGGLVAGGVVVGLVWPGAVVFEISRSPVAIVGAGVLVGFGTRLGGGCTSGHGVCGLSRLSVRSLVATVTFIAVGVVAATTVTRLFGGAL